MLKVENLESGYGPMQVLWKLNLEVKKGSVTALLGPNGSGKTTALRSIMGLVQPWRGEISYEEKDITDLPTHKKVDLGIVLVPEGRHLFGNMNVHENLVMGAYLKRASREMQKSLDMVYFLFPLLKERDKQRADSLSGGEQQMLSIARALMTGPKLIILDEPSQGLAPKLVAEVFGVIGKMRADMGLTVLVVEQNAQTCLALADYCYVMHEGAIKVEGKADTILGSPEVRQAYLGI